MAVITRIVVDVVTEEGLSDRRHQALARELTEHVHVLGVEDDDQAIVHVDKWAEAHTHDTSDGERCGHCVQYSLDYRSGDIVVANS